VVRKRVARKTRDFNPMFFDASRSELKVAKVEIDSLYINEKIARNIGAVMKV